MKGVKGRENGKASVSAEEGLEGRGRRSDIKGSGCNQGKYGKGA